MAAVNMLLGLMLMTFDVRIVTAGACYFIVLFGAAAYFNVASEHGVSAKDVTGAIDDNAHRHAMAMSAHSFTLAEIREHVRAGSRWVLLHGLIIDVSDFVTRHPGGAYLIERNLGCDVSSFFTGRDAYDESVPAHAHSKDALAFARSLVVGALRTDPSALSWADAPDAHEEHASARWTLAKRTVLRGDASRPVVKLVFTHPIGAAERALDWKPASFGRYMVVRVDPAAAAEILANPAAFWARRGPAALTSGAAFGRVGAPPPPPANMGSVFAAAAREFSPFGTDDPARATPAAALRRRVGVAPAPPSGAATPRRPEPSSLRRIAGPSSARVTPHEGNWYARGAAGGAAAGAAAPSYGPAHDAASEAGGGDAYGDAGSGDENLSQAGSRFGPSATEEAPAAEESSAASGAAALAAMSGGGRRSKRRDVERAYSVVRADGGAGLILYVRAYPTGTMSRVLHALPVGAEVEMLGPRGTGLGLVDVDHGVVVAVVQGTGIVTLFDLLQRLDAQARAHAAAARAGARAGPPPAAERKFGAAPAPAPDAADANAGADADADADAARARDSAGSADADSALFAGRGGSADADSALFAGGSDSTSAALSDEAGDGAGGGAGAAARGRAGAGSAAKLMLPPRPPPPPASQPPADAARGGAPLRDLILSISKAAAAPPPAAGRLGLIVLCCFEHEDAIIEREWLLHLHRTCPAVEMHFNLSRAPSGTRSLPNVTTGRLTSARLGALLPAENFRSFAVCGSAAFTRDVREKLLALGLPKASIVVV